MEENIFVFLRLKEGNRMDLELPKCPPIECVQQAMHMPTELFVEPREKLRYFLLCHRRCEINVPDRQAGECFRVAREQPVKKRRAASQIPDDEERFLNRLCLMAGKQDVIQKETKPVRQ